MTVDLTKVSCPHCGESGYAVMPGARVDSAARKAGIDSYDRYCHIGTAADRLAGNKVVHP